jgi:hypothetical protein
VLISFGALHCTTVNTSGMSTSYKKNISVKCQGNNQRACTIPPDIWA